VDEYWVKNLVIKDILKDHPWLRIPRPGIHCSKWDWRNQCKMA